MQDLPQCCSWPQAGGSERGGNRSKDIETLSCQLFAKAECSFYLMICGLSCCGLGWDPRSKTTSCMTMRLPFTFLDVIFLICKTGELPIARDEMQNVSDRYSRSTGPPGRTLATAPGQAMGAPPPCVLESGSWEECSGWALLRSLTREGDTASGE